MGIDICIRKGQAAINRESMIKRGQIKPWMLKKEILILYYAWKDRRTSVISKLPAVLAVIYLLSPIDLIPDFIPFFGYVDDMIIVPLLLNLAIRLLPSAVRHDAIVMATKNRSKFRFLFFLLVILGALLLIGIFFMIRHSIVARS